MKNLCLALLIGILLLGATVPPAHASLGNPPGISIDNNPLTYVKTYPSIQIDPAGTLSDPDGDAGWNGGKLEVQITANAEAADEITIPDNLVGTINTSGTDLKNFATVIGTLSASEGTVTNGTKLTITFNASATNVLVQQVLRAVSYRSASGTPGTNPRTIAFTATDNTPLFGTDSRTVNVANGPIYSLVAGTGDTDNVSFTIEGAKLKTAAAVDYETKSSYSIRVRIDDGDGGSFEKQFAITVNDVNEAPVITSNGAGATASFGVSENQNAVTTVTSTDQDGNARSYSITGGTDSAKFGIHSTTGVLTFISAPDFESPGDSDTNNTYVVEVTVTDNGSGNLTDVQTLTVTVQDVNEFPVITSNGGGATGAVSVAENTTAVTTVISTDPDGNARSYTISGGADQAKFGIGSTTGVLTFISAPNFESPGDSDTNNTYVVEVTATDNGPGNLTDVQTLTVTVDDVNEAPTMTAFTGWVEQVNEDSEVEITDVDISIKADDGDPDVGFNANREGFIVKALTTGTLKIGTSSVAATPWAAGTNDKIGGNLYGYWTPAADANGLLDAFKMVVMDMPGLESSPQVQAQVNVLAVNDAPVITSNGGGPAASVNVYENNTAVTTVTKSDPDSGDSHTFSITGGTDQAKFSIGSTTGVLTFASAPDFETPTDSEADNVYEVQVTVADNGGGGLTDLQDISVTVLAVNEPPVIANIQGDSSTYLMGTGARLIDQGSAASVTDIDSPDFNGGMLTVMVHATNKVASEDQLSLDTGGTVGLAGTTAGSNVTVGGIIVGTLGSAIQAGNDLDINLNANATPARLTILVQSVTYTNLNNSTATENTRTIRYLLDDGDGNANGGNNISAEVRADIIVNRNTAPYLSMADTALNYTENGAPLSLDAAASANDPDGDTHWTGGRLEVQITANAEAGDELSIPDNSVGTINTDGLNIRNGTTVIGTLSASSGTGTEGTVTNNTKLTVTFNASATNALVQQVVRAVSYRSTSENPGTADRTVTLAVFDKYSGTSVDTRTIQVTAVNDKPVAGFGKCLTFDGVDGRITVPDSAGLDITASFSVMAWVKADSFGAAAHDNSIVVKEGADGTGYGLRTGNGGEVQFFIGDGSSWHTTTTGSGAIDAGKWHHVAGVMIGSVMRIYVDGVSSATGASTGSVGVNGIDLEIGRSAVTGRCFAGSIDEVSLWSRALSANEVRSYMLMVIPAGESGLTGYWRFEDTAGLTASDGSSGGNDGILAGGASAADFGAIDLYGIEDTPFTLPNLPGFDPAEGSAVTFSTDSTDSGAASITSAATGAMTYTPALNVNGTRTLTYRTNDTDLDSDVQTVNVHIAAVNDVPAISDIADLGINEDGVASALAFTVGDVETAASSLIVAAASSNTALVPDGNIVLGGSDANRTVTVTPAANANGTATITVTVTDPGQDNTPGNGDDLTSQDQFVITVNPVNDVPSFTRGVDQVVNEDAGPQTVAGWASALSSGPPNELSQSLSFIVTNDNMALFSVQPSIGEAPTVNANSQGLVTMKMSLPQPVDLMYTPAPDAYGVAIVSVAVRDTGGTTGGGVDTSAVQTFIITVNSVNDAPSFTRGADVAVNEDAGAQTVNGWATALSQGPYNEQAQNLSFTVTNDNNALFSVQPALTVVQPVTALSPGMVGMLDFPAFANGGTANLTYTPAADAYGIATVSVFIKDDGGTAIGGADVSAVQSFTITVNAVNDPPTLADMANPAAIDEDASEQVLTLSGIGSGSALEAQELTVTAVSDNPALIPDPTVSYTSPAATGTLKYTPVSDQHGTATITVTVSDTGLDGIPGNGDDKSVAKQFTVTVNPVNDLPTLDDIANPAAIDEDAPEQTVNLAGIGAGAANETQVLVVTAVSDNTAVIPNISVTYASPEASGTLKFTPVANQHGSATITVTVTDAGLDGTSGNGDDGTVAKQFAVIVNPVNDAPVLDVSGSPKLSDIYDTTALPAGMAVSVLLGTSADDSADAAVGGAVAGIAVTEVTRAPVNSGTPGNWQYSLDGAAWNDMAGLSAASSLILPTSAKVRYLPLRGDSGDATLAFRAWDGTTGSATAVSPAGGAPMEGRAVTSAAGGSSAFSSGEETLVQSVISRSLFLAITPDTLAENAGLRASAGAVSITRSLDSDMTVFVASDRPTRLSVPVSVVIRAGQTSAALDLTVMDNLALDGPVQATVKAFASGWEPASDTVTVTDDEAASLSLALPREVAENAGKLTFILRTSAQPVSDLTVALASASPGLTVPASVTVPAGAMSVNFVATVADDSDAAGDWSAAVTATAAGWTPAHGTVTIIDDDDASGAAGVISITLPPSAIIGDGTLADGGLVTLSAASAIPITVTLTAEGTGLSVPATVVVPAGEVTTAFDIQVLSDNGPDRASVIQVWAVSGAWTAGSASTTVFDAPIAETPSATLVKGSADQMVTLVVNPNARVTLSAMPGETASAADPAAPLGGDLASGLRFDAVKVKVDPSDLALYTEPGTGTGKQAIRVTDLYGADLLARETDGSPKVTVDAALGEIGFTLAAPAGLSDSPTRRPLKISFTAAVAASPAVDADGVTRGVIAITLTDSSSGRSYAAASGDGDLGGPVVTESLAYVIGEVAKPAFVEAFVEISPSSHTVSAVSRTGSMKVFVSFPSSAVNLDLSKVSGAGVNEVVLSLPPNAAPVLTKITRYDGSGASGSGLPAPGTVLVKSEDFVEVGGSAPGVKKYAFTSSVAVATDTPRTLEFSYDLSYPLEGSRHLVTASASAVDRTKSPEVTGPSTMVSAGNADKTAGNGDTALFTLRTTTVAPVITGLTATDVPATAEGVVLMTGGAASNEVSQACRLIWAGNDPDSAFSTRLFWSLSDLAGDEVIPELGKPVSRLNRVAEDPVIDLRMSPTSLPSAYEWHVLTLSGVQGVFADGAVRSNPIYLYAVAYDTANVPTSAGGQVVKGLAPVVILKPEVVDTRAAAAVVAWPEGSDSTAAPALASAGSQTALVTANATALIGVRVADDTADSVRVEFFYNSSLESQRARPCLGTDGKSISLIVTPAVVPGGASDSEREALLTGVAPSAAVWDTSGLAFGNYHLLARVFEPGQPVVETWSAFKVGVSHPAADDENTAPRFAWISPGAGAIGSGALVPVSADLKTGLAPISFRVSDEQGDPVAITLYHNRLNTEDTGLTQVGAPIQTTASSTGHVYSGTVSFSGLPSGAYYLMASVMEANRTTGPAKVWTRVPVIVDRSFGISDLVASAPYADPLDGAAFAADITFRTTKPAVGEVRHGLNGLALTSISGDSMALGHSITIHGLAPGLVHYYMVAAETDDGLRFEMDNNGGLYSITNPAAVTAHAERWVKGAVSGAPAGTAKAFLVRPPATAGETEVISEPFTVRLADNGSFLIEIGGATLGADPAAGGTGLPTILSPADTDLMSVEIQLDDGRRAFYEKVSLNGISAAATSATALELPLLWMNGQGAAIDSDLIEATIQLNKGYNMISLPMEPETALRANGLIELLGVDAVAVAAYSPVAGTFKYLFRAGNSFLGTDFDLSLTDGFFVKVRRDMPLTVRGRKVSRPVPIPVHRGYNLVGVPFASHFPANFLTGVTAKDLLTNMGVDGLAVYRYAAGAYTMVARTGSAADGKPVFHAPNGDFELKVGQAIFLKMLDQNTFMGE